MDFAELVYRYVTDPVFWIGGITVPLILGTIWITVGVIVELWGRIQQFFENTEVPRKLGTEPGPSPFQTLMTCAIASLTILLIVLLAVFCISLIGPRLAGY